MLAPWKLTEATDDEHVLTLTLLVASFDQVGETR